MAAQAEGLGAAALGSDVFAQFTFDPSNAPATGDSVTLRLGMSASNFSDFKAKHAVASTLPPSLFNDYTIAYNYVRNFNAFAPLTHCTSSSQPFLPNRYSLLSPISLADLQLKFNCSASDVFPTPPFYMLLSSSAGNETVAATAFTRTPAGVCQLTVKRPAPLLHAQPPNGYRRDSWTCSPQYFADNSTCDCGCGAPDPDCLVKDRAVQGCGAAQPMCDHWGKCSAYETSTLPLRIFLSTPCSDLKLAGKCHLHRHHHQHDHTHPHTSSCNSLVSQAAAACVALPPAHPHHNRRAAPAPTTH
jgi:hypothetical protein